MVLKRKRVLDLQKKKKGGSGELKETGELEEDAKPQENAKPQEDAKSEIVEIIDSLKKKIKETEPDLIGPCEIEGDTECIVERKTEGEIVERNTIKGSNKHIRRKARAFVVPVKVGAWDIEGVVEEFIGKHPKFKIKNIMQNFKCIDLHEHGLNPPIYHTEYSFREFGPIETGIDLKPTVKGVVSCLDRRILRTLVAVDEETVFELYNLENVRVLGKDNLSFKLKKKVDRIKKGNKTICLFTGTDLVTYDFEKLQKWDTVAIDATANNLGEFILLENFNSIKVYRDLKLVHVVNLNVMANGIASWYDRKVVVHTIYKVLFVLDLDTKEIEILSGPPDLQIESLEVYKNVVFKKTISKLYLYDLVGRKKYIVSFEKDFKYTAGDVIRTYNFKDSFRYFELSNPLNNISCTYKESIKEWDAYKDTVYLVIGDFIKIYKGGKLVGEMDAYGGTKVECDSTNVIFTEENFEFWRKSYNKVKKETLEFYKNDLNLILKEDVDKILGRDLVKSMTLGSQKGSLSSQRRRRGGF